jgi:CTP:molybdopterin cytidylyltransferase MocA
VSVPAILLAAGASRRMGVSKALLPCPPDGGPLVRRVARALAEGGASPVFAVVAPGAGGEAVAAALAGEPGVVVAVNPDPDRGMLSSVQAGLAYALPADAFLVCPCDLPRLEPRHVRAVLETGRAQPDIIVAPAFGGKRGHPTLFPASLASEIMALDPTAFGLNEILRRHAALVVEVPQLDDAVLRDADTPDEWRELTGVDPRAPG